MRVCHGVILELDSRNVSLNLRSQRTQCHHDTYTRAGVWVLQHDSIHGLGCVCAMGACVSCDTHALPEIKRKRETRLGESHVHVLEREVDLLADVDLQVAHLFKRHLLRDNDNVIVMTSHRARGALEALHSGGKSVRVAYNPTLETLILRPN